MLSDDVEQPIQRTRQRPRASYCYLLDADADLAQEFDIRMRMVVRQVATVVVFEIGVGDCDPAQWSAPGTASPGLLLLDGTIAVDVQVGDRTATELMGPGDLLQPWDPGADELLQRSAKWHVLLPGRVAILDAGFAERIRPWPQILLALLRRAGKRASDLDVQRAIACQPRLEVRLALLLWHLGARWGRSSPAASASRCPSPTACSASSSAPSARRCPTRWARLADAGLVTGRGGRMAPARHASSTTLRASWSATPTPAHARAGGPRRPWPPGEADACAPSSRPGRHAASASSSTSSG